MSFILPPLFSFICLISRTLYHIGRFRSSGDQTGFILQLKVVLHNIFCHLRRIIGSISECDSCCDGDLWLLIRCIAYKQGVVCTFSVFLRRTGFPATGSSDPCSNPYLPLLYAYPDELHPMYSASDQPYSATSVYSRRSDCPSASVALDSRLRL